MTCLLLRHRVVGTSKPAGLLLDDQQLLAVLFLDLNPHDTSFAMPPSSVFPLVFQRESRTPKQLIRSRQTFSLYVSKSYKLPRPLKPKFCA